jgi:hypothetical protein
VASWVALASRVRRVQRESAFRKTLICAPAISLNARSEPFPPLIETGVEFDWFRPNPAK